MNRLNIVPGVEYGKLKVLKEVDPYISPAGKKSRRFECICSCGNKTTVLLAELRGGGTKSCGCFRNELLSKALNDERKEGTILCQLSTKCNAANSTGIRGVSLNKRRGRYEAYIYLAGRRYSLGYHMTQEEAKEARRIAEEKLWAPVLERNGRELK